MGNALKIVAVIFALLIGSGCTRQADWTGDPRLSRPEVQEIVAQIHELTNRLSTIGVDGVFPWQDQVTNAISAITNLTERVALLDELTDCLFALDASSLTYRRQLQALKITRHLFRQGVLEDLKPRFDVHSPDMKNYYEWYYDILLKELAWSRALIDRTKSEPLQEDNCTALDAEAVLERKAWNQIHYGEIMYYDVALRFLEGSFYYDKNWMPDDQWNRQRIKIEAFLGRPLRPIEQVGFGM